jgi:hypothetical protein
VPGRIDVLGAGTHRLQVRRRLDRVEHLLFRVECNHPFGVGGKRHGELPGATAEIENTALRTEFRALRNEADQPVRVAWPEPRVIGRSPPKE